MLLKKEKKILVVDDDLNVLQILNLMLKKKYDVVTSNSPFNALEYFKKENVDVVLSDIKMPGMDGMRLLTEVKRLKPKIPVIFISAVSDINVVVTAVKWGAYNYLSKPLQINKMYHIIEEALESSKN